MNQAWVAVIGTAIGSIGATGAAVVAGWSARRQASMQASAQKDQWQRQLMRDTYGTLLRAGAEARDELGSLWSLLRNADMTRDPKWFASRLEEIKPMVNAVRLATATVFIEGPESVLKPAQRVEEGIVFFHAAMRAAIMDSHASNDESTTRYMAICSQQRVSIRTALIEFASASRAAIAGSPEQKVVARQARQIAGDSTQELSWLIEAVAAVLDVPETEIDPNSTLLDYGFDSLAIAHLIVILRRHEPKSNVAWLYHEFETPLCKIASSLSTFRAGRSRHGQSGDAVTAQVAVTADQDSVRGRK